MYVLRENLKSDRVRNSVDKIPVVSMQLMTDIKIILTELPLSVQRN